MLKGIRRVRGLGVYDDYAQPTGTVDFGIKNIIYGWNYSGKTTLSRIFSHLERRACHPEIAGYKFAVDTDTGQVTDENAHLCEHVVRVFNSDFVQDNLNFAGSSLRPILLLGSVSEAAQKEIGRLEAVRKRVNQAIANQQKNAKADRDALSTAKTAAAASIKKTMSLTDIYTATQMDKDIDVVNMGLEDYKLGEDTLSTDLKLARTSDQEALPPLPKIGAASKLTQLWSEATALLGQRPEMANAIHYLTEHPDVERWIEHGLPLHDSKESCEFCGAPVTETRLETLRGHFSKDQADFKTKLNGLLGRVSAARIAYAPRKAVEFSSQFRQRFEEANGKARDASEAHDKLVAKLEGELQTKIGAPFAIRELPPLDGNAVEAWLAAGMIVDLVIEEHNQVADHFKVEKAKAIRRAKLHFAHEFIEKQCLDKRVKKQGRWKLRCKNLEDMARANDAKRQELEATISQSQKGREEINYRIESLLGSDSVQIVVVKKDGEERFQLVRRDGSIARHLSEGEKTAIAFSFFLTKLRELKDFDKAIVYIDDPISSLDSNHIFQVTAIIRDVFFHQLPGSEEWRTKCKQIFFSTHNFEFFGLLRELKPIQANRASHYLIRRVSPTASSFGNMPDSMLKYSSEYHFLFSALEEFRNAPDKTDYKVLMHIPNAVRRFVELYTYSKYPDGFKGTVDQRADRLFGTEKSKRILKVLHYFSHANNIERIATNSDLMCDIEAAVDDLMALLAENDPLHLEALRAAL